MKKICFVVQRYGKEIVGGAETLCMQYANELKRYYSIDVVTSCAVDYNTWENYYAEGATELDGVGVYRYASKHPRRLDKIGLLTEAVYGNPNNSNALGKKWLKEVGPYCPGMRKHITKRKKDYDLFIFVGYHYYNSTFGMPCAPEKAVFLPTAHDEPPIRKCNYFQYLFSLPRAFIFLSKEEQDFVLDFFCIDKNKPRIVAGMWVEELQKTETDVTVELPWIEQECSYIVYAGRIDETKNIGSLLAFFNAYKQRQGGDVKLVLMGKNYMELPTQQDIVYTGFVSEAQKFALLSGAKVFVMPSENESLSIGTLEAMHCGVPVLVNGNCSVLKEHVQRSGAGLCFVDEQSFCSGLHTLLGDDALRSDMRAKAVQYVENHYAKQEIIDKIRALLDETIGAKRKGKQE